MMSFLVTGKMDPRLRARIYESIGRGHRKSPRARLAPRSVALLRLLIAALALTMVSSYVMGQRGQKLALEAARDDLLVAIRKESASLSQRDRDAIPRAHQWLSRSSVAYEGDVVSEELRGRTALSTLLLRPSLYVRGPIGAFSNVEAISRAAAISQRDAFVSCLLSPPSSRDEKALLSRVQHPDAGGAELYASVHRLLDAEVGLPFFLPPWEQRVRSAEKPNDVKALRAMFDKAPLEDAKRAIKSDLLIFAFDEPGDTDAPVEIDGERAHDVRVVVVDLVADKLLLRLRKRMDPKSLASPSRSAYTALLDNCALAFDVIAAVKLAPGAGPQTDAK